MRRSEITEELIEFSKRAKELGFPQDVEEGDWYGYMTYTDEIFLLASNERLIGRKIKETETFLILSFSRCLEWFREKGAYTWLIGVDDFSENQNATIYLHTYLGNQIIETKQITHHEAIAKAVVKILEESDEKK